MQAAGLDLRRQLLERTLRAITRRAVTVIIRGQRLGARRVTPLDMKAHRRGEGALRVRDPH
jgi:hypothetical protein